MLFTTPLVLNDGTANHSYNWMYQMPGQLAGVYTDQAADPALNETIRSGHMTEKSGRKRHTVSLSGEVALTDPGDGDPSTSPVIVSISVTHHPKHAAADVQKRLAMCDGMLAGVTAAKLCRGEL